VSSVSRSRIGKCRELIFSLELTGYRGDGCGVLRDAGCTCTRRRGWAWRNRHEPHDIAVMAGQDDVVTVLDPIDKDRQVPGGIRNADAQRAEPEACAEVNGWVRVVAGIAVDAVPAIPGAGIRQLR
jgi:hypothetical protein